MAGTSAVPGRIRRIYRILACPSCSSNLVVAEDGLVCDSCSRTYPIRNGKIYFIEPPPPTDALDVLKNRLKHTLGQNYYRFGVQILAPTYPFNYGATIRMHCNPSRNVVVDLGCGNNRVDDQVVTLDSTDYDAVDIVADVTSLPFRSGSIDAFASRSVLEHVQGLSKVVHEMERCTRGGGLGVHLIPFLFPYHASPHDYWRVTHSGAAALFSGWSLVEQSNATGPFTLFVACAAEFAGIVLSFGSSRIRAAAYLGACLLLFPIKFLDAPFVRGKAFLSLAPTILTIVRKPELP